MLTTMGWLARLGGPTLGLAGPRGAIGTESRLGGERLLAAVATGPRSGAASGGFNAQTGTPSRIRLPGRKASPT